MDPPFTFDLRNDMIYAMQIDRYQVDLFDTEGRHLKSICQPPDHFVRPDTSYVLDERKYGSQKKLYNELIRLSKSWTRIMKLDVVNDQTLLIMTAANGWVKETKKPYIIDLWTPSGEPIALGIASDQKFLCSDKEGFAYFLVHSDEETALEHDPTYVIGKYKIILPQK